MTRNRTMDVIISDLRLPGLPGTELIKRTPTPVLIMTSYASLRSAIDSMKIALVRGETAASKVERSSVSAHVTFQPKLLNE